MPWRSGDVGVLGVVLGMELPLLAVVWRKVGFRFAAVRQMFLLWGVVCRWNANLRERGGSE